MLDPPFNRRVLVQAIAADGEARSYTFEYADGAPEAEGAIDAAITPIVELLQDPASRVDLSVELVFVLSSEPEAGNVLALARARLEGVRRCLLDRGVDPGRITTTVL